MQVTSSKQVAQHDFAKSDAQIISLQHALVKNNKVCFKIMFTPVTICYQKR